MTQKRRSRRLGDVEEDNAPPRSAGLGRTTQRLTALGCNVFDEPGRLTRSCQRSTVKAWDEAVEVPAVPNTIDLAAWTVVCRRHQPAPNRLRQGP